MSILTEKQLASKIASIGKSSKAFRDAVQEAVISALYYAYKDHNPQPLNNLLGALGNGSNVRALTHYCTTFGPVYVKDEKFAVAKSAAKEAGITSPELFAEKEEELRKVMWFDFNVEGNKAQNVWDTAARLDSFLAKLDKHDAELAAHLKREALAFQGARSRKTEEKV